MKMVALLRGINVGGNRKVPMAELRAVATELGLRDVATYIQSGNIVFDAGKLTAAQVATRLEGAIEQHFGFFVDVIVRTAAQWKPYAAGSPFPDAADARAKLLHLGLARAALAAGAVERLIPRAVAGERIAILGDAIWVDFNVGVAGSKLTPALFDKAAGSTVTMRNWNTVLELNRMLGNDSAGDV